MNVDYTQIFTPILVNYISPPTISLVNISFNSLENEKFDQEDLLG
jgi:hypothetical protein